MTDLAGHEDTGFGRRPMEERCPPLGAPSNEISQEIEVSRSDSELKQLEDEHEQLNSSLSALTTHFAQVQFRLKQVVAAPTSEKEDLLQNLEKFAFEGIPDVAGAKKGVKHHHGKMPVKNGYMKKMKEQKKKQEKLINQLKEQLQEMEEAVVKGASSSDDSPQKLIEKQKKLLSQLSVHEDHKTSIGCEGKDELFNDQIPKEQVIKQITKQIIDLEKFIKLLQGETGLSPRKCRKCTNCSCEHENIANPMPKKTKKKAGLQSALQKSPMLHKRKAQQRMTADREEHWEDGLRVNYTVENFGIIDDDDDDSGGDVACCILPKHAGAGPGATAEPEGTSGNSNEKIKEASLEIIKRALAILQIFAMSQFGCSGQHLQDKLIQKAMRTPVPPYDYLIRSLRTSVEHVMTQQASVLEELGIQSPGMNHSSTLSRSSRSGSISSLVSTVSSIADGSAEFSTTEAELIRTIRREFSACLRDLFEHGLEKNADYRLISAKSLVQCIVPASASPSHQPMHVWDLFMTYYNIKNGREYNAAVPRKLSESFGIDVSGSPAVTSKQTLLRTIHFVKSTHERCKRSKESMFRALVSAGLNQKKLSLWCKQIVKCGSLIDAYYQSWSCLVSTGFQDVLDILETLTPLDFCLPEDLAIRHLTRANEAFGESY